MWNVCKLPAKSNITKVSWLNGGVTIPCLTQKLVCLLEAVEKITIIAGTLVKTIGSHYNDIKGINYFGAMKFCRV